MKSLVHPFKPVFNSKSKVLILGSFPSVKSREESFYYAHPQNRFWKVLENIFEEKIANKEEFLLKHNIALWDVIQSCEIKGSSDSSIKNVKVNDIKNLIKNTDITVILLNGNKAYNLYQKYIADYIDINVISLPSTSPANAKYRLNDLVKKYSIIKNFVN